MSEDYFKGCLTMFKVYLYTNIINNKKYCGITNRSLKIRSEGNGFGYMRSNPNSRFAKAIRKHGWENFKPEILYEVETKEEAMNLEIETIAKLNLTDFKFGYNLHFGGTWVNPEHCARKGKQNGMYGKGYKLEGSKNGRANRVEIILGNNRKIYFDTQKQGREYLGISKYVFTKILNYNGKYKLSIHSSKRYTKNNKHLENVEINIVK